MSVTLMSLVWDVQWPTQSQLLVALKLADHANDDGSNVYPSKSRISRQAQCSESTVQNVLRAFRDCGLLRVVQEGGKGPGKPTVYEFNVELLKKLARMQAVLKGGADEIILPDEIHMGSTVDPLEGGRGQSDLDKGSTDPSKGSKALTPNHQIEPSNRTISAHARAKGENSDLEDGSKRLPVRSAIRITPADASWREWLDHLRGRGHAELADRAELVGEMTAFSRWPRAGPSEPLPKVPKPAQTFTDRMIGEPAA